MKILVVEYITGGGMVDATLPPALVHEGELMLHSLLADLLDLHELEIYITRDYRLFQDNFAVQKRRLSQLIIARNDDLMQVLQEKLDQFDALWPIAPESDNILADLCSLTESAGKILLNSSSEAVEIAGDKLKTYACLKRQNIKIIPGYPFSEIEQFNPHLRVLKPFDGVGSSDVYLLKDQADFQRLRATVADPDNYILQPYIPGRALSLCCLFANGRAWLISCNEQHLEITDGRFALLACKVNVQADAGACRQIIDRIAMAMPGLWGYAGIDLIDSDTGPWVVEINPRLTSSCAGLRDALGINVAALVLGLLRGLPEIMPCCNNTIVINIAEKCCHAS